MSADTDERLGEGEAEGEGDDDGGPPVSARTRPATDARERGFWYPWSPGWI